MEGIQDIKRLGDAAYMQGRYEGAIQSYNLAIEKNVDNHENVSILSALHSNRCMCYIKVNNIIHAWQDAQMCLSLRPRWAKSHLRCAQCRELQGELEDAIAYYQRAAELDISLSEEVIEPIRNLRAKLSQQRCQAIMLPPLMQASPPKIKNNLPPPIYYASMCPQPIQLGSHFRYILAAAYGDGTVRLWCMSTGTLLQTLLEEVEVKAHSQAVTTLAWSADGTMLASGSLDMTCSIWKLNLEDKSTGIINFKRISILKGHSGRVSAVRFAPFIAAETNKENDSSLCSPSTIVVITASTDLSIKVWKINFAQKEGEGCACAECLYSLGGHSSLVSDIDVDPLDHQILVSASGDAQFKLWDLNNNGQLLENVAWESGPVVLCGFLPSSQPLLLTAHAQLARQEGRILLWDVLEKKDGWVDGRLAAPAWSLDGFVGRPTSWDACCCCCCCNNGSINENYEMEDPKSSKEYEKEENTSVILAVACSDGTVRVWELVDNNTRPLELFSFEIAKLSNTSSKTELPPWHAAALSQQQTPGNAYKVKLNSQGQLLAVTSGDANENISIWNIQNGEEVCTLAGHSGRIRSLEWSKDGEFLFSASEDGAIRKWTMRT
jgi:WD40 repeat protein